jgi:UDP-N-acetylglucosamine--N-acetylmuramyl-(pentapeptide) pyrophosphoryl-undecaprenol N-acetylglucosamine transferase
VEVIGNPIRVERRADRAAGIAFLDLDANLPTVLVCGGSRGARTINRSASAAIPRILERKEVQFVFLTGEADWAEIESGLKRFAPRVKVLPFLQQMHHAYSVADVAVSRAGASAVFELAAFGVPTVFVPYPHAADDHQRKNVECLSETGAALVVDNSELDGERLQVLVETLLDDGETRGRMSERMKKWSRPDADRLAAEKILELLSQRSLRVGCAQARSVA